MSIKFVCSCGKHLKARDDMASLRVVCPRCGFLAGVPALKPNNPDSAAPLTPAERVRLAASRAPSATATATLQPPAPPPAPTGVSPPSPRMVRLLSPHGKRRTDLTHRHLEKYWHECLLYPLRTSPVCFVSALALTAASAAMTVYLPDLLADPPANVWTATGFYLMWGLLLVLMTGVPCSFLDAVLASAAQGEVYYICWSGHLLVALAMSGLRWLACFIAGPVVFVATASLYWLYCGDPSLLDGLIVAELVIVAVAYQILSMLSLTDRGRFRDLNPLAVADLTHRLGRRGGIVALAAACLLLAHGMLLIAGVAEFHRERATGVGILFVTWMSAIFWSTFVFRLLGVWCHRTRPRLRVSARAEFDCSGQSSSL